MLAGVPLARSAPWIAAYLCDAGVGALAVGARQLQPLALVDGAVLSQGALALTLAPAALEVGVRLEAQATALAHGSALIEVNCGRRARGAQGPGGSGERVQPQPPVMGRAGKGRLRPEAAGLPSASGAHTAPLAEAAPTSHRAVGVVERL